MVLCGCKIKVKVSQPSILTMSNFKGRLKTKNISKSRNEKLNLCSLYVHNLTFVLCNLQRCDGGPVNENKVFIFQHILTTRPVLVKMSL